MCAASSGMVNTGVCYYANKSAGDGALPMILRHCLPAVLKVTGFRRICPRIMDFEEQEDQNYEETQNRSDARS